MIRYPSIAIATSTGGSGVGNNLVTLIDAIPDGGDLLFLFPFTAVFCSWWESFRCSWLSHRIHIATRLSRAFARSYGVPSRSSIRKLLGAKNCCTQLQTGELLDLMHTPRNMAYRFGVYHRLSLIHEAYPAAASEANMDEVGPSKSQQADVLRNAVHEAYELVQKTHVE